MPASILFAWDQVPAEYRPWVWLFPLCIVCSVISYLAMTYAGNRGWEWLTFLISLLTALGLWTATRWYFDGVPLWRSLDPRTQSWALLWDVAIAGATAYAALAGRYYLDPEGWYARWWWAPVAYVGGWAIGWVVRYYLDYPGYQRGHALALIFDPAKVFHDEWTWPAIAGALIYFGVPVLLTKLWTHRVLTPYTSPWVLQLAPYAILAAVVVWILLGNTHDQHLNIDLIQTAYNYVLGHPVPHWRG